MGTHASAPLSIEGRRQLVEQCMSRPIAHVAAEMGISRACASKWVNRYRRHGELGLHDRSSTPHRQPAATPGEVVERIEQMRRNHKWSARRIAFELSQTGPTVSWRTVTRHLAHLGLSRRRCTTSRTRWARRCARRTRDRATDKLPGARVGVPGRCPQVLPGGAEAARWPVRVTVGVRVLGASAARSAGVRAWRVPAGVRAAGVGRGLRYRV